MHPIMNICFIFHIGVNNLKESTKLCSVCNVTRIQVRTGKKKSNEIKARGSVQTLAWREAPVQAIDLFEK